MYIFEWCTLLKCSSKCPCTCILTAIINISNKIGSILINCMSNECIHAHYNLAKSGIWSIDCEIWDMGYWGVKNLGYGIWAPLCHPPTNAPQDIYPYTLGHLPVHIVTFTCTHLDIYLYTLGHLPVHTRTSHHTP